MLRRQPTRIELKPDDKDEFEAIRKEQELQPGQQNTGDLSYAQAADKKPKPSVASRIGLNRAPQ